MADFVLSCCSTADLTKEHFQQRDISYICFHFSPSLTTFKSLPFDRLMVYSGIMGEPTI